MAERRCDPVRGICRLRGFLEFKLLLHHETNLVFGRITTPDDSFLDLPRSVLCNSKLVERRSQENSPSSVSQLESTLGVLTVENILDRHYERLVTYDQGHNPFIDLSDPVRENMIR
jgi:hypothetical protein